MSLLAIGSVAFDALETPYGKTDKIIGGAGTYISLSASYFKIPVNLVAVVGEDFPQEYIQLLESKEIDTTGLQIKKGEKTFFWSGRYHNNMNSRDTLVTELNVLGTFDPIIPEQYQDCQYLMLGNLTPAVQITVIERLAKRPKLIVMDTMNFWMDIAMDDLKKVLTMIDVLCINDEEARQLSGDYSLRTAAKTIMAMGPKTLIIKKGEHGALLFQGDKLFFCPALVLEQVFDPTGAGDTFVGGFIGYLAKTDDISFENMKRAIVHGSAMASFCVEKFGTERIVDLSNEELTSRINEFKDLAGFDI
ncbi:MULTISPECIES: PfkB family carbohydrate kinase [unclassified Arcicella]|uniref:PfkB family carbohydrate kinase n=1 Tax=unclassified Arcicella TaxID=2644986 RepID=UPI00285A4E3D|nr:MULTISPECIES: PfkB family carbohydrate kinase [unclassified Arcicella]MDR6563909.1 sugar/nucleoside kinase (ribokinase family) [Arcicella sp. BE51]MDR6813662.1 sugar/nucleoside kinase (ribokinase family) [Arcicella sp. BE140]MDR6824957.1 sugar/nucleoside kinase (ribokinase family) [Arcicella sp. BE139]